MKKYLIYFLAMLFLSSLTACSSDEVEDMIGDLTAPVITVTGVDDGIVTSTSTIAISVAAPGKIKSFKVTIPNFGEMDFAQAPSTQAQQVVYLTLGVNYEDVAEATAYVLTITPITLAALPEGEISIPVTITDMNDQKTEETYTFTKQ
ncbi:hypothetical protein [Flammeovirga sp. OC4]|uniref:hypothetical protein n=1 Tax=Flammeovirga sp. OC4 TaxID=1382345 RepID=UPI0005C73BE9|nr:hypothetical protein [Flammeovirga sp. OC4]